MLSEQMQAVLATLKERQAARAGQPERPVDEVRATFVPADSIHPIPDDVAVEEVTASEVTGSGARAYWLAAPGVDSGRVLLFLHGGGFQLGSLASDGELASRLGRAAGMRVLFLEYRLAPEHAF